MEVLVKPFDFSRPSYFKLTHAHAQYNTYVCSDLHGNFMRLLHALVTFGFIIPTPNYNHNAIQFLAYVFACGIRGHQSPLNVTEGVPADVHPLTHNAQVIERILNQYFSINRDVCDTKKIIFLGDTIFDRGPSDFITLVIFRWMRVNNILHSIMLGNHEFELIRGMCLGPYGDRARAFQTRPENRSFFFSFDFLDYSPRASTFPDMREWETLVKDFFRRVVLFEFLEDISHPPTQSIFAKFSKRFSPPQQYQYLFLTHTPPVNEVLSQIMMNPSGPGLSSEVAALEHDKIKQMLRMKTEINTWLSRFLVSILNQNFMPDENHIKLIDDICIYVNHRDEAQQSEIPRTRNIYGHLGDHQCPPDSQHFSIDSSVGQPILANPHHANALHARIPFHHAFVPAQAHQQYLSFCNGDVRYVLLRTRV